MLASDQLREGLSPLIAPLDSQTFMAEFWGRKCFYRQPGVAAIGEFPTRLADCSAKELLSMAQDPVLVMHSTATGEYRGTKVAATDALDFYEAHMPLYFDLSHEIPEVAAWIAALAESLGQKRSAVRVSIFISPKGGSTELHFDSNENFTIQLRGHKRWRMASNPTVINPLERYTVSGDVLATMALYCEEEMPSNLELHEVADLTPGSMLYVPRGYWHTVEALEPSVSLNFCIRPESWVSFFLPVLERRLLAEPEWRATAMGIRGDEQEKRAARTTLSRLLKQLATICGDLNEAEIIPSSPADQAIVMADVDFDTAVRPNPTALLYYGPSDVDKPLMRIHIDTGATTIGWTVGLPMRAVCRWIALQNEFTLRNLLQKFEALASADIQQLFYKFVAAGFLLPIAGVRSSLQATAAVQLGA